MEYVELDRFLAVWITLDHLRLGSLTMRQVEMKNSKIGQPCVDFLRSAVVLGYVSSRLYRMRILMSSQFSSQLFREPTLGAITCLHSMFILLIFDFLSIYSFFFRL